MVNPTPALADPLGAPASVTLTPGRRQIKVDWTAPANPNGTVANYVATASTGESCATNDASTFTCTISVAANINITVGVKACPADTANCSVATQAAGPVKVGPPGTPAAPTVVFNGNPNTVTLNWVAPDPGVGIDSYKITATPSTGLTGTCGALVASPTTACDFGNLADDTSYTFKVAAIGVNNSLGTTGTSAASPVSVAKVAGKPHAVAKPTVTRYSDTAVTVTWDKPSGTQAISGYAVTGTPAGSCSTTSGDATECRVTGLDLGTSYTFTVAAKGDVVGGGVSDASPASDAIKPGDPAVPATPTVELGAVAGAVTVYWDQPTDGGTVSTYVVTPTSPDGGSTPSPATCTKPGTVFKCDFTLLQNGKSYKFKVAATNAAGTKESGWSTPIVSEQPDKPATPTVTLGDVPGKVNLAWAANSTGGPVVYYGVTVLPASGSQVGTKAAGCGFNLSTPTCTITGLDPAVSYTFKVTAYGDLGSVDSDPSSPAILPNKPNAPTSPTLTLDSPTGATVNWTAPVGGGVVASYTATAVPSDGSASTVGCNAVSSATLTCAFTGLDATKSYTFKVTATNAAGGTDATATVTTPNIPSAPQTVTAALTTSTPGSVDVSWSAPATGTATRYIVTVVPTDGSTAPAGCTTATTSCTIGSLDPAKQYAFTVRAENLLGGTNANATAAVKPDVPGAPTSVTTTVTASGSVTVNWAAPATGGAVANYTVTATDDSNVTTTPCNAVSSATTTCAVTGLNPAKTYTFTVRAANAAGGTNFGPTPAVLPAGPGAPTNVQAVLSPGPKVIVTWDAPTGAPVTLYTVTAASGDGGATRTCTVTPPATQSCVFDSLTTTAHYQFTVRAENAVDHADASAVPAQAIIPDQPGAPGNVAAARGDAPGKATITWDAPTTGGAVVDYMVTPVSTTAGATIPTDCTVAAANPRTCTFTTLTPAAAYTFKVTATNPAGSSFTSSAPALVPNTPDKPTDVTVTVTVPGSATVTWPAATGAPVTSDWVVTPTSADGGATPTPSSCSKNASTAANGLTCTFTGLTTTASYSFTVQATNEAGSVTSDPTMPVVANKPNAPSVPMVKVIAADKVSVTWTAPPTGGGPVTKYTVTAYTQAAPSTPVSSAPCTDVASGLACEFGGLIDTEKYTFKVTAIGPGGQTQGDASTLVSTAGPGKPAAPAVALTGTRAVTVTWAAPNTGGEVTSYSVTSTPDISAPARCTGVKTLSCVYDRLVPGTAYTFQVWANGTGDRSTPSDASTSITVAVDLPGPQGAPVVDVLSASSARLTWTAPIGGGPAVTYTARAYTSGQPDVGLTSTAGCTNVSTLGCDFTGLNEAETYTFRVTAQNSTGDSLGERSKPVSTAAPGKPAAPTVQLSGPNAATVTWTAAPGNGPVSSYSVISNPDVSAPARCTNVRPPLMTCVFDRLRSGTEYTFKVVANGSVDRSTTSDASTAVIAGPPAMVAAPTVSAASATSVTVSWNTPPAGGVITGYQVQSDPSSAGCSTTGKDGTSCVVSGLTAATSYTFKVKSVGNGGGDSDWSPASVAIVPGAPAPPTDIAVAAGDGLISVSWTLPANTNGIVKYRAQTTPASNICETATNTDTECVIPVTQNLAFYTVTVTSVGDGVSATSLPSQRVRPTAGRPGSPTGVSATAATGGVLVKWTVPAWAGNGIVRYIASATDTVTGSRMTCVAAGSSVTSCTIPGLTGGTTYAVTVVSVGRAASGYSDPSTPISFTAKAPPGAPTNVTVTGGVKSLVVAWKAGTTGDGIGGYTATATGGTTPLTCSTTSATATTCTITTTAGGPYSVSVVAKGTTDGVVSAASSPVDATAVQAAAPTLGTTVPTSNGSLTLSSSTAKVSGAVTVSGTGFAPFTTIQLGLYSSLVKLATVVTDKDGAFTLQVTIPAGTTTGSKTVVAAGLASATSTTIRNLTAALTLTAT